MAGLEPAYGKVPLNVVVMQQDYVRLNQLKRHPRGVLRSMKVGARTMWAKATGKNLVGMGRALIGPLRIGLQRAGVPVELNTAFTDLSSKMASCPGYTSAIPTRRNPLSRS